MFYQPDYKAKTKIDIAHVMKTKLAYKITQLLLEIYCEAMKSSHANYEHGRMAEILSLCI